MVEIIRPIGAYKLCFQLLSHLFESEISMQID